MFTPLPAQKHRPFGALAWPEREKAMYTVNYHAIQR